MLPSRSKLRWALCICLATGYADASERPDPAASVVKVTTDTRSGLDLFGSAVVIAPGKLVTNCHVVRDARAIHVEAAGKRWQARIYAGDSEKDLCLLTVPGLPLAPVPMRSTLEVGSGETVTAIGFPDGGLRVDATGRVESLHSFQDARVIRTSAPFDRGASGGGLFTDAGELIGILTFKAPRGTAFHFAIPVDWVLCVEEGHDRKPSLAGVAFWDREPAEREQFLRASWFHALEDWRGLYEVCERWTRTEPNSDEASFFMALAASRLRGGAKD